MIETRPAAYLDAVELAPSLRPSDAGEIVSVWRIPPLEGLVLCLLRSDRAFSLVVDGKVVGLWGVTETRHGGLKIGLPWMLGGDALFARRRELIGRSRAWVDGLLLDYDVLTNLTSAANRVHLRWLAWCGFRALRVHRAYGAGAVPFCEFYRVNGARRVCERGVRETLLARDAPDWRLSAQTLLSVASAAARALAAPAGSCTGPGTDPTGLIRAARGATFPGLHGLLIEVARHQLRHAGGGAVVDGVGLRWCRQMVAVTETCYLEPGSDPAEVAAGLDRVPARAESGRDGPGAMPHRSSARLAGLEFGGLTAEKLAVDLVSALTLGGRVSRVQGRRLRLAALGLEPVLAERAAAVARADLSALWAENALPPPSGVHRGRGREWVAPLWHEAGGGDGLSVALRMTLDADPAGMPPSDCLSCAAMLADRMSRSFVPGLRFGGVATGVRERQKLYWLLRAWLVEIMTGSPEHAAAVLAWDISALLVVGDAESGMLERDCRSVVEDDCVDVLSAIERQFPTAVVDWRCHVLPAALVPGMHLAQLEPALVAWHLTCLGEIRRWTLELADSAPEGVRASSSGFRALWRTAAARVDGAEIRRRLTTRKSGGVGLL